jgi:hypothetical protein
MAKRKKQRDSRQSKGTVGIMKLPKTHDPLRRAINQAKAYRQGKRVMVTVANPNKEETAKPFIRVEASTVWK